MPAAYPARVLILRLSGKRTLSKLNAFDLIVYCRCRFNAGIHHHRQIPGAVDGLAALFALVLMQFVVTAHSVRFQRKNRIMKAEPTLLLRDGQLLRRAMRRVCITEGEIQSAARASGVLRLDRLEAVFHETDGSLTASPRLGGLSCLAPA